MNRKPPQTVVDPLPRSLEAERAVLGAVLLDEGDGGEARLADRLTGACRPDDFMSHLCRSVFTSVQRLKKSGALATVTAVIDDLDADGKLEAVGGRDAVLEGIYCPTTAAFEEDLSSLRSAAANRDIHTALSELAPSVGNGTPALQVLQTFEDRFREIRNRLLAEEHWDPPIPFFAERLPEFPVDALQPLAREWCLRTSEFCQVPVDVPAAAFLGIAAAALTGKAVARVTEGHFEQVCLYVAAVMDSGDRKSPVLSAAMRPLVDFEMRERERLAPFILKAKTERRLLEKQIAGLEKEIGKKDANVERLKAKVLNLESELAQLHVPAVPRLFSDDVTTEKLGAIMMETGGATSAISAEGGLFENMSGRYSARAIPNFDLYLKAYSGDFYKTERFTRADVILPHPALTMLFTMQPSVLNGIMSNKEFQGRGLCARFLYVVPETWVGGRENDPPPVPDRVQGGYTQLIRYLLQLTPSQGEKRKVEPHVLPFEKSAREAVIAFRGAIEPRLARTGDLSPIRAWAAKLPGQVARIAAVLHLADHASLSEVWRIPIGPEATCSAVRIGEYLIPQAKMAFSRMGADGRTGGARSLLDWIQGNGLVRFQAREAHRSNQTLFPKAADVQPCLQLLEEHGYIRQEPEKDGRGRGRKPSPTYLVNPLLNRESRE